MAETVRIPVADLGRYMRTLGDAFGPAILRGLTGAAVRSVATLSNESNRKRVRDTGRYLNGWGHSPAMHLGPVAASIRVYNDAPYSGVIELGRRAGRKMPWVRNTPLESQPIYLWCIRQLGMTADEAAKAARPIAWSIKKKGIKGKYVVRDVLRQLGDEGAQEVAKALDRGMRDASRRVGSGAPRLPSGSR
jgi:hypothetical protein